jgi:hypothetical protein
MGSQVAQEHFNMSFVHLGRVDFSTVKSDKPDDLFTIGLFRAIGIMMIPKDLTHLVHQL